MCDGRDRFLLVAEHRLGGRSIVLMKRRLLSLVYWDRVAILLQRQRRLILTGYWFLLIDQDSVLF